jgi:hypothetical protein
MSAPKPDLNLATASPKLLVADLLQRMSDDASFAEIVREIKIMAGVRQGLIESNEGKGKPHEEFMRELRL